MLWIAYPVLAGRSWRENAPSTLAAWVGKAGKRYRKKSGALNAAGLRRLAFKRPLIGESGDLRRQIGAVVNSRHVSSHYCVIATIFILFNAGPTFIIILTSSSRSLASNSLMKLATHS